MYDYLKHVKKKIVIIIPILSYPIPEIVRVLTILNLYLQSVIIVKIFFIWYNTTHEKPE